LNVVTGSEGRENALSAAARGSLLLAAPTALAGLLVAGTAWREGGSILVGDWLPYAIWKLNRHTGVRIEPTDRQRRHPLVYGWPVILRLLRQQKLR